MEKEMWDIYDSCFTKTGKQHERGNPIPEGSYHLVVHIYPVNSQKQILVQKRSETVDWFPGCWAATGGSALAGEDAWTACKRELHEELGLTTRKEEAELAAIFKKKDSFNAIWIIKSETDTEDLILQKEEVADARWMTSEEIKDMADKGIFHHYSYQEWLFDYLDKYI